MDKHTPHFMTFCGICYSSSVPCVQLKSISNEVMHFHSNQVWNKRRTNKNDKMVLGRHFEHEKINAQIMRDIFEEKKLPWCKENGLELLIMDKDPKLHGKAVVTFMKENGVQIYPVSGKKSLGISPCPP